MSFRGGFGAALAAFPGYFNDARQRQLREEESAYERERQQKLLDMAIARDELDRKRYQEEADFRSRQELRELGRSAVEDARETGQDLTPEGLDTVKRSGYGGLVRRRIQQRPETAVQLPFGGAIMAPQLNSFIAPTLQQRAASAQLTDREGELKRRGDLDAALAAAKTPDERYSALLRFDPLRAGPLSPSEEQVQEDRKFARHAALQRELYGAGRTAGERQFKQDPWTAIYQRTLDDAQKGFIKQELNDEGQPVGRPWREQQEEAEAFARLTAHRYIIANGGKLPLAAAIDFAQLSGIAALPPADREATLIDLAQRNGLNPAQLQQGLGLTVPARTVAAQATRTEVPAAATNTAATPPVNEPTGPAVSPLAALGVMAPPFATVLANTQAPETLPAAGPAPHDPLSSRNMRGTMQHNIARATASASRRRAASAAKKPAALQGGPGFRILRSLGDGRVLVRLNGRQYAMTEQEAAQHAQQAQQRLQR